MPIARTTFGKRILLVEDDVILTGTQTESLKNAGYRVTSVSSGEEALELCKTRIADLDLILMDIDLGDGIDGTIAAEEILKRYTIPLIFVSSHTEKEVVEKTENITNYGYVVKNSGIVVLDASIKMAFKLLEANRKLTLASEALEKTNELLERTSAMVKVGGWELDVITNVVTYSKETARIHEVDYPFVPPKLSQGNQYYPPEAWPIIQAAVIGAIENGTPYDLELPFITEKGNHLWVRAQGFAVRENGKTIKLRGIFQDITDMKREKDSKLETELKFQTIFENIVDAVLIINQFGIIQLANKSTTTMFGYETSELLGKNIKLLMPNPYKEEHDTYLSNYLKSGIKKIIGIGRIITGLKKNGEVFPILLSVSEWKFKEEVFFTGTIKDITYRKLMEEQLKLSQNP